MPTRWSELPWTELRDELPEGLVALLPLGAVEAHGPHLPLETDGLIARGMAEEARSRLASRGVRALLLPGLDYSAAPFAAAFPGTISLRPETVTSLIVDAGRSLAAQSVRCLALANAHLDPAHLASLHAAVEALSEEDGFAVAFPDLTRRRWATRLTDEFRSGACHAGRFEGSIVLALRPDLVREEIRGDLSPNPRSLSEAIRAGKRTFEESGGPQAYFGHPAEATADEGRATLATLGEILAEAVEEVLSVR